MGAYCVVSPKVRNKNTGELANSKLFKELKNMLGYDRAKDIYYRTKNPKFTEAFKETLQMDDYNEPTLVSLLRTDLSSIIGKETIEEIIAAKSKLIDEETGRIISREDNAVGYYSLLDKVNAFNRESEYRDAYAAVISKDSDDTITVHFALKKDNSSPIQSIVDKQFATERLNNKIHEVLQKNNMNVGALSSLEERKSIKGMYGGNVTVDSATGIATLIRIAKGSRGEEVLGEEFGHFIIESIQDKPFISRLINLLKDRTLSEEVLGEDFESYSNFDDEYLAHEAAARLLLSSLYQSEGYNDKAWERLLNGALRTFRGEFSKMDENEILSEIESYMDSMSVIAKEVYQMNLSPRLSDRAFYDLDRANAKMKTLLEQIYKKEVQRYDLMSKTNKRLSPQKRIDMQDEWNKYTSEIKSMIALHQYKTGIISVLNKASRDIQQIKKNISSLVNSKEENMGLQARASILNNSRQELEGLESILELCDEILNAEGVIEDLRKEGRTNAIYNDVSKRMNTTLQFSLSMLRTLMIKIDKISKEDFARSLMIIKPEGFSYNKKNQDLTEIDYAEMISLIERAYDIGTFSRWLNQASQMTDPIIQLSSLMIKRAQERHRINTDKLSDRIKIMHRKLRNAGINDENWMFEQDENGNPTYNYISNVSYAAFYKAYNEYKQWLEQIYTDNPFKTSLIAAGLRSWLEENTQTDEETNHVTPNEKIYASDAVDNLSAAQREYYNEFMEIRQEMLDCLPNNIFVGDIVYEANRAIQIRKSLMDRLKNNSVSDWMKQVGDYAMDSIVRRNDDSLFNTTKVLQDLAGKKIYTLPMYFVGKVEDASVLSHETSQTLLAFCDMAMQHNEMDQIVDILENGRAVMEKRTAIAEEGGKTLVSNTKALGADILQTVSKDSEDRNFLKAYNDLLESQLYGRYKTDAGTQSIGNVAIDRQKATSLINTITAANQLGFNILAALTAVFNDGSQILAESITGRFFTAKEIASADKEFFMSLPKRIGEIGKNEITSKVGLFQIMFNILHDQDKRSLYNKMERSRLTKFINLNSLFFFMNIGAEFGETRTAIAQAKHTMLRNIKTGEDISLWDALEVKYYDADGNITNTDQGYGGVLQFMDGVTTIEKASVGDKINSSDISAWSQKFLGLNQRLFGVYNKEDRNALQRTCVGSMVMMYRNYFVSQFQRRYGAKRYDTMLNTETEGYIRTLGKFTVDLFREAKNGFGAASILWDNLEEYQKDNIKRALTEISTMLLLSLALALMTGGDWDDKHKKHYQRMLSYVTQRTKTELNAMFPTGITGDVFKIIKSPAASVSSMQMTFNLLVDIVPGLPLDAIRAATGQETKVVGEDSKLQSGKFKGKTVLERDLLRSPFCPIWNQIYRAIHPEEANVYYNQ